MTEKQFTFNRDTVAINLKTPIVYNNEQMSIGEVLEMLNNLYDENEQLYELIDFVNTLIAFKTSESCQKEWEKRLKELKE